MAEKAENLLDYLHWRGDLTQEEKTWNEVDFLIFSELVHTPLERTETAGFPCNKALENLTPVIYPEAPDEKEKQLFLQRYSLWKAAAASRRFGTCRLSKFSSHFDENESTQFAAAFFTCGDTGIIAFRGTDATLVGWHEDFCLSFESPIGAQKDAVSFLSEVNNQVKRIYLCGHSKGGNLAMYAAVHVPAQIWKKILGVYNYDGPGLDDGTLSSAAMAEMESKIYSFMPESSIIGKLLGYQTRHRLIASDSVSIMQHNPFYWHLDGPGFEYASNTTLSSEFADRSLHLFLLNCNAEQRKILIDTLFSILSISGATKISEIGSGLLEHAPQVLAAMNDVPKSDAIVIRNGIKTLLSALGSSTPWLFAGLLEKYFTDRFNKPDD